MPVTEHAHPKVGPQGIYVMEARHGTNLRAASSWGPQFCIHQQSQIDQNRWLFGAAHRHLRKGTASQARGGLRAILLQLFGRWSQPGRRILGDNAGEEIWQLMLVMNLWMCHDAMQAFLLQIAGQYQLELAPLCLHVCYRTDFLLPISGRHKKVLPSGSRNVKANNLYTHQ